MPNNFTGVFTRDAVDDRYAGKSAGPFDGCPVAAMDKIGSLSGYQYESDDFTSYTGLGTGGIGAGWNVADTGTSVVQLEADLAGGYLQCQTGGTENNSCWLQRACTETGATQAGPWYYTVGKRMWCFAKFNLSDADDCEAAFGLMTPSAVADFETIAEILGLADGIYFEKAETATEFDFHVRKNDVSTESTLVSNTFADGVDQILGFTVDVSGNVKAYSGTTMANLTEVASVTAGSATIPNDVSLALTFGLETGAGAAKDLTMDWYLIASDR
jgi:hypothetical protein